MESIGHSSDPRPWSSSNRPCFLACRHPSAKMAAVRPWLLSKLERLGWTTTPHKTSRQLLVKMELMGHLQPCLLATIATNTWRQTCSAALLNYPNSQVPAIAPTQMRQSSLSTHIVRRDLKKRTTIGKVRSGKPRNQECFLDLECSLNEKEMKASRFEMNH